VESHPIYKFTAMVELYRSRSIAMKRVAELVERTNKDYNEVNSPLPKILSAVELSEIIL
jgi:hypothetical protein